MKNIVASKRSTDICLAHKYFLILNNPKITEFKGLYNEKQRKLCKSTH